MGIIGRLNKLLGKAEPIPTGPVEHQKQASVARIDRRRHDRVEARSGTKVLIIDDSPTIIAALRKFLRTAGYKTFEALDAENGIAVARREKPELIFLDIVLPGMNGFAALRTLRRDPELREIPVIMMSGNEQATEQFFGSRIGADDFMKKPFSREEVFARVVRLLDENRIPRRPAIAARDAQEGGTPAEA